MLTSTAPTRAIRVNSDDSQGAPVASAAPVVVKFGGAAIDDPEACARSIEAVAELHRAQPGSVVVVHGGGAAVDRQLRRLGHTTTRHEGLRITPSDQMTDIAAVLDGSVNTTLCGHLRACGVAAVGLRLTDGGAVTIETLHHPDVDLGHVGVVSGGDGSMIRTLMSSGYLPVISSVGHDSHGTLLNVNADDAAAGLAQAMGASCLVLMTDVAGVMDASGSTISSMDAEMVESMISEGVIAGGMIAKVRSAITASAQSNVPVLITSWRQPESLLSLTSCNGVCPDWPSISGTLVRADSSHSDSVACKGSTLMNSQSPSTTAGSAGMIQSLPPKDLLSLSAWPTQSLHHLIDVAETVKASPNLGATALSGKTIALLFEKPSLRTRVSFEAGITKLGGHAIYLDHKDERIGVRESTEDYGRNLERWTDAIVARTFAHDTLVTLAASASIPIVNALSDLYHPCQALADVLTLKESCGTLKGLPVAYLGDGNNVCHSLMLAAAHFGIDLHVVSPADHHPAPSVLEEALALAAISGSGGTISVTSDLDAVSGCKALYTDTWVSMGESDETGAKQATLASYRVTSSMMDSAHADAVFMHCLPAHRGDEVSAEVIDGPSSVVFDQAENRMHAQNALLIQLLAPDTFASLAATSVPAGNEATL